MFAVAEGSDVFCTYSSATERDEWLEAIAKAIDDYTKKKITFISSRSQEEVTLKSVWVYVCFEDHFTLYASMFILRLYHLRLRVLLTAAPRWVQRLQSGYQT